MRLRIIPREERFFDMFAEDAANVLGAARLFEAMLRSYDAPEQRAKEIREAEHRGDELSHEIGRKLESTFVTPFDREDIIALASGLDDIVDFIEEVADFLGLYRIEAPMEQAQRMARVLHEATRQINDAIPRLRTLRDIHHYTVEVNRLENEGDRILREAVASLFNHGIDPMMVIRWKDIYERLEDAIDAAERVANVLANIVIKNA
jgi:predicted phosphate transport protein (TIGR00153 family)